MPKSVAQSLDWQLTEKTLLAVWLAILLVALPACDFVAPATPTPPTTTPTATQVITPEVVRILVTTTPYIVMITNTPRPTNTPTVTPTPTITPYPWLAHLPIVPDCKPGDQDEFVWAKDRFLTDAGCIRVTGTVQKAAINQGADDSDGSAIINLKLDQAYDKYLQFPATIYGTFLSKLRYLRLEIVCYVATRFNAFPCDADPDPVRNPLPSVGKQIWVEGRWVINLEDQTVELHPVYRWGPKSP